MTKQQLTEKDYEKLGRTLQSIYEGNYVSRWRVYHVNFVRGIFFGLGVTLGGTILVALLIWLLGLFTSIPLLGAFLEAVRDTIDS